MALTGRIYKYQILTGQNRIRFAPLKRRYQFICGRLPRFFGGVFRILKGIWKFLKEFVNLGGNFKGKLGKYKGLKSIHCRFGTIFGVSPGMRFHTAVNKFCLQAVMNQPLTVWKTALYQKRPYLDLTDAIGAILYVAQHGFFSQNIYNVLTENLTVDSILRIVKAYVPNMTIEYVEAEIMNQLSYEVSSEKFRRLGFTPRGSLETSISETITLLETS